MIEYITAYWYLFVILIAMIVLTVFVSNKALQASTKRRQEMNEIIEKAKRAKELRDEYKELTAEKIANAPASALFEGIALNLEAVCQKAEDTDSFYDSMSSGQKNVYALYYLLSDAKETTLSSFFKSSYRPLTSDAVNAAKEIFGNSISKIIETMFGFYDENGDSAPSELSEIDRLNDDFDNIINSKDLSADVGRYIKENPALFQ